MILSNGYKLPKWLIELEDGDLKFVKEFILNSGSLKELANVYDVSYPTVRLRLDRLIEKIKLYDTEKDSDYILFIKKQVIEARISRDAAKILIDEYRRSMEDGI